VNCPDGKVSGTTPLHADGGFALQDTWVEGRFFSDFGVAQR